MDAPSRLYQPRLLRFVAFSTGDLDVAVSITQDCLMKAYGARDRFRGECSAFTWLMRIAVNLTEDQQRVTEFRFWREVGKRAVDVAETASVLASGKASPEKQLLARERARQVGEAIEKLSPNQQRVFLLRFVEEVSLDGVCLAAGMTPATVKTHPGRAVKAIRAIKAHQPRHQGAPMRHARTMITALRFATAARAQTNAPTPPMPAQMAQHGVQRYTALLSLTSAQHEQAPAIFTPEAAAEAGLHTTEHADGEALNAAIKTGGGGHYPDRGCAARDG